MARTINRSLQDIAAVDLAAGLQGRAVARKLGLAANTVSRWRQDPRFDERVEHYRAELIERRLAFLALLPLADGPADVAGAVAPAA